MFFFFPAKPSVKRSAAPPVTDVRRPSAPVFLKGLQDLRVMDGSQVTMTVEVTGMKVQLLEDIRRFLTFNLFYS